MLARKERLSQAGAQAAPLPSLAKERAEEVKEEQKEEEEEEGPLFSRRILP